MSDEVQQQQRILGKDKRASALLWLLLSVKPSRKLFQQNWKWPPQEEDSQAWEQGVYCYWCFN